MDEAGLLSLVAASVPFKEQEEPKAEATPAPVPAAIAADAMYGGRASGGAGPSTSKASTSKVASGAAPAGKALEEPGAAQQLLRSVVCLWHRT